MLIPGFIKGMLIGFLIAVPVGPVALLCIQRTLVRGKLAGIASGLGAAFADTLYGALAVLGLTAISEFVARHQAVMHSIGGLVFLTMGVRLLSSRKADHPHAPLPLEQTRLLEHLTTAFAVTITNPLTFGAFIWTFTAAGMLQVGMSITASMLIAAGVFCGSLLWWTILTSSAHLARRWMDHHRVHNLNRIAGAVLALFGIFALVHAFWK